MSPRKKKPAKTLVEEIREAHEEQKRKALAAEQGGAYTEDGKTSDG